VIILGEVARLDMLERSLKALVEGTEPPQNVKYSTTTLTGYGLILGGGERSTITLTTITLTLSQIPIMEL